MNGLLFLVNYFIDISVIEHSYATTTIQRFFQTSQIILHKELSSSILSLIPDLYE
ncbi:MAG: hypothetical protein ACRCTQ_06415 [Brevinemataceae bacterium]